MSFFDALFGWTKSKDYKIPEQPMFTTVAVTTETKPKKTRKPRVKKTEPASDPVPEKPAPKVQVTNLNFDPKNPRLGSLELDWNDEFIQLLKQHGYAGATAEDIVDSWLNDICRTILANNYPGANITNMDGTRYVNKRDLGDGKTEVS
jgi:hypothetical protein